MEEGHLVSGHGIQRLSWLSNDGTLLHKDGKLFSKERIRLPGSSYFGGSEIPAFICKNCRKIIINLSY